MTQTFTVFVLSECDPNVYCLRAECDPTFTFFFFAECDPDVYCFCAECDPNVYCFCAECDPNVYCSFLSVTQTFIYLFSC